MSASNPTLELLPSPLLITWIVLGDVWANFASSLTVRFFSSLARRNLLPIAGPSCFVRLATVGQCIHRLDCATTVGESISCNFLLAQNIMVSNYILVHGDALVLISRSFPMLPDQIAQTFKLSLATWGCTFKADPQGELRLHLRVTDRLVQVKVGDWVVFAQPNCYAASYQVKRLLKDFLVGAPEIYGEFLRVLGGG